MMASPEPKAAATQATENIGRGTDSTSRGTESIETEKKAAEKAPVTQTSTTGAGRDDNAAAAANVSPLAAAGATATLDESKLDTDASKYSLEDLLQFQQQQQQPVFSRLDFTRVKSDIFDKLFRPSRRKLLPPRGYRVSVETIHEWFGMTRAEQEKCKERAKKEKERQDRIAKRSGTLVTPALDALASKPVPMAPPLSHPIPFLEGKLSQVKLYYQEVPEGFTDWTNGKALKDAFPPFVGCTARQVPQSLIQDAQTDQDKLTIISWWRFLTKDEQRAQIEALRKIYASPLVNNRKLPPDFWEKIAAYEEKRKKPITKHSEHGPVDPTGNDFYVSRAKKKAKEEQPEKPKDMSCRGWRGEKFEKLFQACFLESVKDVKMEGSAKIMETIPIYESVTKSKYAKDFVFVREGDDYILRSVGCTMQRQEGSTSRFCPACLEVAPHVHLRRNVQTVGDVEAKQKEQIASLRTELKSTSRREKRLREKLMGKQAVSTNDDEEPSPKKQRASSSPRRLPTTSVPQHDYGYAQQSPSYRHGYGF